VALLSEIKTDGNHKILVIAEPGVGKTCLATSFPGKTRVLDFDNKADSAAQFWRSKGETDRLGRIDVTQFPRVLDSANSKVSPLDALLQIFQDEFIPQQQAGKMEFDTLVLDSITTFSSQVLKHIVKTNPGIKRTATKQGMQPGLQDYGILRREFERIINGLISLPCNVIMLAHIAVEKDELTGRVNRFAMMDGSFAKELPVYFKEVWRLYVDKNQRMIQTQSDNYFSCRSQIAGLPNPSNVNNGYESIKNYMEQ